MEPVFFAQPSDFRTWLERHHEGESELLVGFYKKGSKRPSITWPESVDEALCFGWIDGVRRRVDDVSYSIRFTPRKAKSTWSAVNVKRVAELEKRGLLRPA
ncbi:MAG TPA: bacteriocin-protection protein, partial [Solirubrobacteraceae bacterium]